MKGMGSKSLVILFGVLSTVACSELQIDNPNPRTEVPELPGQGFHVQLEGSNAHKFQSTSDASARPPSFQNRTLEKSSNTTAAAGYSPIDNLDFGLEWDPFHGNGALVGKYQFLGESGHESKEGNISGLLHARFGGGSVSKSGDQKGVFGPGGYPWKGKIQTTYTAIGASFGYRVNEQLLGFAGASFGNYGVKTNINQDAANGDAGGSYSDSVNGNAQTVGLGVVLYLNYVNFVIGGDYTTVKYSGADTLNDSSYHVGVIFH